jgi:two-component system nitrogen regulation response regulator NtrX
MVGDNGCLVLVVDDDAGFREVLCGFLESRGYLTSQACSAAAAMDELHRHPPEFMFLDIYMPGMTGLQLLTVIKKQWPQVNVIMMSGYATEELAKEAMDLGAYDFLNKPIELEHLDDILPYVNAKFSNRNPC